MRAVYINSYFNEESYRIFSSVSMPITKRKNLKRNIKAIQKNADCPPGPLAVNRIEDNPKVYRDILREFSKEGSVILLRCRRYDFRQELDAVIKLIALEKEKFEEPMRVYIPFRPTKYFLKRVQRMADHLHLDAEIVEISFTESIFSQIGKIFAGCVAIHDSDDFIDVMDTKTGKLVNYIFTATRRPNEFMIAEQKVVRQNGKMKVSVN